MIQNRIQLGRLEQTQFLLRSRVPAGCLPVSQPRMCLLLMLLTFFVGAPAWGQAPGFLWSTNLGARVFAIDSQTNAYASLNGNVIQINAAGVPVQTNAICPRPGTAQRDAAGNFYFAGTFTGVQNFGGVSLTNNPGTGPAYLAKYSSAGTLLWAHGFGPSGYYLTGYLNVGNLSVDPTGVAYVIYTFAYSTSGNASQVLRFDAAGGTTWESRVGATSQTNGYVLAYKLGGPGISISPYRFDQNGGLTPLPAWQSFENYPTRPTAAGPSVMPRARFTMWDTAS
ncbi:MAG: type sorting protein [Pedosphaera sp.]|nr:type sorting protein [Pedosphaera sp.]